MISQCGLSFSDRWQTSAYYLSIAHTPGVWKPTCLQRYRISITCTANSASHAPWKLHVTLLQFVMFCSSGFASVAIYVSTGNKTRERFCPSAKSICQLDRLVFGPEAKQGPVSAGFASLAIHFLTSCESSPCPSRICQRGNLRFDRQQNKRPILPQCELRGLICSADRCRCSFG